MANTYTVLLLLHAHPAWLRLDRAQRAALSGAHFTPAVERARPHATIRFHDSEHFHARISDFLVITTEDLAHVQAFIEALRDTPLLGEPYFQLVDLIIGQGDLHMDYDVDTHQFRA